MTSFISSFLNNRNGVIDLDAESFEEQMKSDENSVLLDVRTNAEFYDARIPNSILIDMMNPSFTHEIEKLDKSKSYFLYCRSGNRSVYAGKEMIRMGFEKVYNLTPGIIGWRGEIER